MTKSSDIKQVVLALPTTHDVHSPCRRQFGEAGIHVLSKKGVFALSRSNIDELKYEIRTSVAALPEGKYCLILAGLSLANIIAYRYLSERFGHIETLTFDVQRKRYAKCSV